MEEGRGGEGEVEWDSLRVPVIDSVGDTVPVREGVGLGERELCPDSVALLLEEAVVSAEAVSGETLAREDTVSVDETLGVRVLPGLLETVALPAVVVAVGRVERVPPPPRLGGGEREVEGLGVGEEEWEGVGVEEAVELLGREGVEKGVLDVEPEGLGERVRVVVRVGPFSTPPHTPPPLPTVPVTLGEVESVGGTPEGERVREGDTLREMDKVTEVVGVTLGVSVPHLPPPAPPAPLELETVLD